LAGVPFDPKFQCTATSKQSGQRCRRRAVPGGSVCKIHGGGTKAARAAGERKLAAERAERKLATYGLPRVVDPHTALLEELHRTAGHVAWLGDLVASLHHDDDPEPTVLGEGGDRDPTEPHVSRSGLKQYTRTEKFTVEQESVWLRMYRDERAHLARVAKDCIAAGIAERQVQVIEAQGRVLADAFRAFATALGLDPGEDRVRTAMRSSLAVVTGGAAA
jgi:hypothetical protein